MAVYPLFRCVGKRVLLLTVAAALVAAAVVASAEEMPGAERRAGLIHLVRQDCGSCHGMQLTGGLGPALTPEALRDKPVEGLAATIYAGRPGTAMPGWKPFLSEAEARWIAVTLKAGFPDAPH